jgi:hypothetical protein
MFTEVYHFYRRWRLRYFGRFAHPPLEAHTRGLRLARSKFCDRIVFDLDPGEAAGWKEIVAAARAAQRCRFQLIVDVPVRDITGSASATLWCSRLR